MQVSVARTSHPLRVPLATAYGPVRERGLFTLTLTGSDGVSGRGEAAPLEPYDGVPDRAVAAALDLYAEILRAAPADVVGPLLLDACREAADLPQALAAVDLALWDRASRREDRPLASLMTDRALRRVAVNATLGALEPAAAAAAAREAVAAGYRCLKVKVGTGDDRGRVAAVRLAVGDGVALRLDANGAWTVDEAVREIEALAVHDLELVEEPVHGIAALQAVRERVPVRISMDETAAEPGALTARVADAICLKISRCGGLTALLAQASLARATGADVYLASTFDGPIGIAAAVHAAAALRVELPCGLATLGAFEDPVPGELAVEDGAIVVPKRAGL